MQASTKNKILFDTYAWIEYFRGTNEGKRVKQYIEADTEILTPAIVVAELSDKFRRVGKGNVWEQHRRMVVKLRSRIIGLLEPAANAAGKIKHQQREQFPDFPLADGVILALARQAGVKVLTGDDHLRHLPQAIDLTKETERSW